MKMHHFYVKDFLLNKIMKKIKFCQPNATQLKINLLKHIGCSKIVKQIQQGINLNKRYKFAVACLKLKKFKDGEKALQKT